MNIRAKAGYHHGNLKPALVAAALKELAKHGVEGLSLRSVARRAGVSAPAVYRHFADKDALVAAVAMECQDRLDAITREARVRAEPHPLAQYRAIGISIVRFAAANPEHYRVICTPGIFDHAAEYRARRMAEVEAGKAELRAAQRAGQIADIPLDQLMLAAQALVDGLAHQIASGVLGDVDDARAEALATAATEVLGLGLIPRTG